MDWSYDARTMALHPELWPEFIEPQPYSADPAWVPDED